MPTLLAANYGDWWKTMYFLHKSIHSSAFPLKLLRNLFSRRILYQSFLLKDPAFYFFNKIGLISITNCAFFNRPDPHQYWSYGDEIGTIWKLLISAFERHPFQPGYARVKFDHLYFRRYWSHGDEIGILWKILIPAFERHEQFGQRYGRFNSALKSKTSQICDTNFLKNKALSSMMGRFDLKSLDSIRI